ncbi:MAG TPA: HAD-IB family hydrolase [Deltaproteobacteria bacterium]|nr:HAD-IB family hydrolase [Deltaproteobacteria bacterium]
MGLALFDLDHTLLDVNSGALWVRYEWRMGRIGLRDVAWAGWWLSRYSLGLGAGLEAVFEAAVRGLAGSSEAELERRVRQWFEAEIQGRLRPGGAAALSSHRDAGDRLVLATSSTQFAARAAADAFGLEPGVCTDLEVLDGALSGRIATLAIGSAKARAAEAWAEAHDQDLGEATFYSDSMTDLALLERVGTPVVVNPDRRLRREAARRGWPVQDWGVATPP